MPGAYIIGNSLHYQDYKRYEALEDRELKEEALRNKAIMEGTLDDDDESSYERQKRWNVYDDTNHDHEYEMDHEVDKRQEICSNETYELPVCNIRRFKMIKYSFRVEEEYVAVKEYEYNDLTSTSKDACRAYQEILDEGWMVSQYGVFQFIDTAYWSPGLAAKKSTKLVKYQSSGILCAIVVMLE
ncbi:hypothetical protein Tco_0044015 [Tanacetum coccineum]